MIIKPNTKLKLILLEKNITQRQLAFAIDIDESRISKIIKGYETPTNETKEAICDYLDYEIEAVF